MTGQTPETQPQPASSDVRDVVRTAIEEFIRAEQRKSEPAYQTELQEERRRREALESKLNVLVEENKRAREMAEEADRHSQIKSELQRLGVAKVDLAFRAVKDDITRTEDGQLMSRGADGRALKNFLAEFVQENPELLPARIAGGSGIHSASGQSSNQGGHGGFDLDKIKPGMSREDMDRVRQEIARLVS